MAFITEVRNERGVAIIEAIPGLFFYLIFIICSLDFLLLSYNVVVTQYLVNTHARDFSFDLDPNNRAERLRTSLVARAGNFPLLYIADQNVEIISPSDPNGVAEPSDPNNAGGGGEVFIIRVNYDYPMLFGGRDFLYGALTYPITAIAFARNEPF